MKDIATQQLTAVIGSFMLGNSGMTLRYICASIIIRGLIQDLFATRIILSIKDSTLAQKLILFLTV